MVFERYLKESALKIDQQLNKILSQFLKEVKETNPKLVPLVSSFVNSCQGGKRIRGVLCKLGFELPSSKFQVPSSKPHIYKICAALEIMHTSILIHDDIIDKSPLRRNQPSLYKSIGKSLALTLGDLGFFLAVKTILRSNFKEAEKNKAVELVCQTMIDTAIGQIMDIKKDDPLLTARLKTARYTISGPLKLGAILGGADEKLLGLLGVFGENLGIAFQMRDDILDGERDSESQALVLKYANQAKKLIPKISSGDKMVQLLMSMTEFMVERTK